MKPLAGFLIGLSLLVAPLCQRLAAEEANTPVIVPVDPGQPPAPASSDLSSDADPPEPSVPEIPLEPVPPPQADIPEKEKLLPTRPPRFDFPAVDGVLIEDALPTHPARTQPRKAGKQTGPPFIGHRAVIEKYTGWGWIKPEGQSWGNAQWAAIQEDLEVGLIVPGRYLAHPDQDNDTQYRLFGQFTDDKAYEPNLDVFIPIFQLHGFERIGKAPRPKLNPPRGTAPTRSRPTTGGARSNPFGR